MGGSPHVWMREANAGQFTHNGGELREMDRFGGLGGEFVLRNLLGGRVEEIHEVRVLRRRGKKVKLYIRYRVRVASGQGQGQGHGVGQGAGQTPEVRLFRVEFSGG